MRTAAAVLAAACALLPAGAPAQSEAISVTFKVPAGWSQAGPMLQGQVYFIREGDTLHTLIVRSLPGTTADVHVYAAQQMDIEISRGAEVADEGAVQVCNGEPAHRWTVRSASIGDVTETHFISAAVTGGIAVVSYAHTQGAADRRDALDAMTSACPGPVPNPVPSGWNTPKTGYGTTLSVGSPDATSTFIAAYRVLGITGFESFERENTPRGNVVADRREPCGGSTVHRIDVQTGGQIAEVAIGFLRGTAYRYVYTRPLAHAADPAAERALTAFCRSVPMFPGTSGDPV